MDFVKLVYGVILFEISYNIKMLDTCLTYTLGKMHQWKYQSLEPNNYNRKKFFKITEAKVNVHRKIDIFI